MTKMEDSELLSILERERAAAKDYVYGTIGRERRLAYEYYQGRPFGNEEPGQSHVVSQLVSEVIDSALPDLVKMFTASDRAIECMPRKEGSQDAAEQATDLCNYVMYTQNAGFLLLLSGIKDALLAKTGVWRYYWNDSIEVAEEDYENQSLEQVTLLAQDPAVEIVAASPSESAQDLTMPDGQAVASHYDVKVKKKKGFAYPKIDCINPERLLVSTSATSVDPDEIPYIGTGERLTASQLLEMGYAKKVVDGLSDPEEGFSWAEESQARKDRTGAFTSDADDSSVDPTTRKFWYFDEYIFADRDGDGIAERLHVCSVGSTILHEDVCEHVQLAIITPKIMPHEFFGVSLADDVMDLQLLKSQLWREMMNANYLANRPRTIVIEGQANIDDILTPMPGGVIRVKSAGAVTPFEHPMVAGEALKMVEFLEQEVEGRTGISRYYQGLDPDSLNKTATGMNILNNRAQSRVELIARTFAETGIKRLFKGILFLLSKHQNEALTVRVRNKSVTIDPRVWKTEYDFSINVGLGTGSTQERIQQHMMFGQAMQQLAQAGAVTPKNAYYFGVDGAKLLGYKDTDRYLTDPTAPPDPQNPKMTPPQDPSIQLKQMELEYKKWETQQNIASAERIAAMTVGAKVDVEASRFAVDKELHYSAQTADAAHKVADIALHIADHAHEDEHKMHDSLHEAAMAEQGYNADARSQGRDQAFQNHQGQQDRAFADHQSTQDKAFQAHQSDADREHQSKIAKSKPKPK